jgi:hypothetical protein
MVPSDGHLSYIASEDKLRVINVNSHYFISASHDVNFFFLIVVISKVFLFIF